MKTRHLSVLIFTLGLLIIIFVHILDYRQTTGLVRQFAAVKESQQTLNNLEKLASTLKDIQRAHRGYVITEKAEFLNPYQQGIDVLPTIFQKVQNAFAQDTRNRIVVDSLDSLILQKVDYVEDAIVQVNTGRKNQAIEGIAIGKAIFDRMMNLIARLEQNQRDTVGALQKQIKKEADANITVVIAGLISSSILLLLAMAMVYRAQSKVSKLSRVLDEANKELSTSNEELRTTLEQLELTSEKIHATSRELSLREKELLLAQRIAKTGSVYWNTKTDEIRFTEPFAAIWNLDQNHLHNFEALQSRIHADDIADFRKKLQQVRSRKPFSHEFRINIEGSERNVFGVFEPYDDLEKENGYIGIVTDTTEAKQATREVEASEKRFRALLDAAPDPMIITSDKGIIVLINRQTEYLFGYTRDELLGSNIELLLPQNERNRFSDERATLLENPKAGRQRMALALQAVKKDGSRIPVEVSIALLFAKEGLLITASLRDITRQRQAEQRVLAANEELEKANEALKKINSELNDFSYSISHDLRAPLRAINGYSALLQEDFGSKLDENGNRVLGVIQRNAHRMDELINDLLELARLGTKPVIKQKVNMRNIIDAVLSDKTLKEGTKISIEPMEESWGDPSLLRQVWENLLSNAIKFSSTGASPEITVRYRRERDRQIFTVTDNGVGFDPTYSDKLFKVFSRLHAKHEFEGTGAGLAISRKIVEAHGGTISGRGELKRGAEFTFSLPVDDATLNGV